MADEYAEGGACWFTISFSDRSDISDRAEDMVAWAVWAKLLPAGGQFVLDGTITGVQMLTILNQLTTR